MSKKAAFRPKSSKLSKRVKNVQKWPNCVKCAKILKTFTFDSYSYLSFNPQPSTLNLSLSFNPNLSLSLISIVKVKVGIVRCFVAVWWLCWAVLSIVLSINDATPLSFSLLDLVSPAQPINKKRKSSRVCIVSQLPAVGRSIDWFACVRVIVVCVCVLLLIAKIVNLLLIDCWGYIFE